tara:strand:- start:233 stop:439 length:207 start_codon:yes stop_codon:yes gene_type:complete
MFIKITYVDRDGRVDEEDHYINSDHIIHMYQEDFKGHFVTHVEFYNGHSIRVLEEISELLKMINGGRK